MISIYPQSRSMVYLTNLTWRDQTKSRIEFTTKFVNETPFEIANWVFVCFVLYCRFYNHFQSESFTQGWSVWTKSSEFYCTLTECRNPDIYLKNFSDCAIQCVCRIDKKNGKSKKCALKLSTYSKICGFLTQWTMTSVPLSNIHKAGARGQNIQNFITRSKLTEYRNLDFYLENSQTVNSPTFMQICKNMEN